MFIRIRKESNGYYLFNRDTRTQKFVSTVGIDLHSVESDVVINFLKQYYQEFSSDDKWELMPIKNQDLELSAPVGMYFEISKTCNLDCGHCYKHIPRINTNPTFDNFKKLLDDLHAMGVFEIRICGNEPTTSPFLGQLVEYAKKLKFFVGINTNCYFDSETQDFLLNLKPDYLVVSLDGDRITHDSIRKQGSYDRVISMLERLAVSNIKHRINNVVSKKTLGLISHVAHIALKYGSGVSYLPFKPVGKNHDFNRDNSLTSGLMRNAVEEIERLRALYPGLVLLTYFDVLGCKSLHHHSMEFNSPCPARKNGFISYSGDFFPCDFLRFAENVYFCGNVFVDGFENIWRNSSSLKKFQNLQHDKCKTCKHLMVKCHGGCISAALFSTGKVDDELCFVRTGQHEKS